ncbi:MAG: class C sortase, partial [Enterococcus sp.]|nr:class C sortase [Enterococcus sp.]
MTVKKKKKNQKMYSKIAMVIIFLVGSLIMLYPFYIDALNNYLDQVRVTRYQKQQKEAYEAQQLQRSAENK